MLKIFENISYLYNSFIGIVFPNYCPGCGKPLSAGENYICLDCIVNLPYTYFNNSRKNIVTELLFGRFTLEKSFSLCYYIQKGHLQHLLHNLKYNNKPEIGVELGNYLGQEMKKNNLDDFDLMIPVPLHPKRQKTRGYNQSEEIAKGIFQIIEKEIDTKSIVRNTYTITQTKKNKYERWENVEGIFSVKNAKKLENKHILIVDDVITTGSTIESLANVIKKIPNTKISITSLAVAKKM
jgi:ComF family protein